MKYTWEYTSGHKVHEGWKRYTAFGVEIANLAEMIKEATYFGTNNGLYKPGDIVNNQRIKDSHKKVIWLMENGKVVKDLTRLNKRTEAPKVVGQHNEEFVNVITNLFPGFDYTEKKVKYRDQKD